MRYPQWSGAEPCRQVDPEIFYPTPTEASTPTLVALIKATCQACPTFQACRDWGLHHEEHGVWGGMLPSHRAMMRRAMGIELTPPTLSMNEGVRRNVRAG